MQGSHQFDRDAAGSFFSLRGVEICAELAGQRLAVFPGDVSRDENEIAGTDVGHKGSGGRRELWKRYSQRFKFFVDRHLGLLWLNWERFSRESGACFSHLALAGRPK